MPISGVRRARRPDEAKAAVIRPRMTVRLRRAASCLGSAGIAIGAFAAGLGWAFAGSLWLRLGTSPQPDAIVAWRWLGGEALIALAALLAFRLAGMDRRQSPGG